MSTNTIKFYSVGPIPLYPSELVVLDQNTGLAAVLPANTIITEMTFKLSSTNPLTPNAMVKLGVVGNPTLFNPLLPVTTNELNDLEFVTIYPEANIKQVASNVDQNLVLTAGLQDITDGQLFVIVRYRGVPSGVIGGPGNNTTTTL
jgi:hypothetical protein